jgi:hypothetical protein
MDLSMLPMLNCSAAYLPEFFCRVNGRRGGLIEDDHDSRYLQAG